MENRISFYYEADAQGTHFQEGIHEDIWELWYRQTASDEGQPHHSSKGKLRRKLRELRKKLPVFAPPEGLRRLFRRLSSAGSKS